MTESAQPKTVPRGLSTTAFVLGLVSLALLLVFVVSSVGAWPIIGGVAFGIAAVVIGVIALTKRQPKTLAWLGLVVGGIVALLGFALILFALLFVGALSF